MHLGCGVLRVCTEEEIFEEWAGSKIWLPCLKSVLLWEPANLGRQPVLPGSGAWMPCLSQPLLFSELFLPPLSWKVMLGNGRQVIGVENGESYKRYRCAFCPWRYGNRVRGILQSWWWLQKKIIFFSQQHCTESAFRNRVAVSEEMGRPLGRGRELGSLSTKSGREPCFQDLAAHQNHLGNFLKQCASAPLQARSLWGWSSGIWCFCGRLRTGLLS